MLKAANRTANKAVNVVYKSANVLNNGMNQAVNQTNGVLNKASKTLRVPKMLLLVMFLAVVGALVYFIWKKTRPSKPATPTYAKASTTGGKSCNPATTYFSKFKGSCQKLCMNRGKCYDSVTDACVNKSWFDQNNYACQEKYSYYRFADNNAMNEFSKAGGDINTFQTGGAAPTGTTTATPAGTPAGTPSTTAPKTSGNCGSGEYVWQPKSPLFAGGYLCCEQAGTTAKCGLPWNADPKKMGWIGRSGSNVGPGHKFKSVDSNGNITWTNAITGATLVTDKNGVVQTAAGVVSSEKWATAAAPRIVTCYRDGQDVGQMTINWDTANDEAWFSKACHQAGNGIAKCKAMGRVDGEYKKVSTPAEISGLSDATDLTGNMLCSVNAEKSKALWAAWAASPGRKFCTESDVSCNLSY